LSFYFFKNIFLGKIKKTESWACKMVYRGIYEKNNLPGSAEMPTTGYPAAGETTRI